MFAGSAEFSRQDGCGTVQYDDAANLRRLILGENFGCLFAHVRDSIALVLDRPKR